jgi:hypothetical protein
VLSALVKPRRCREGRRRCRLSLYGDWKLIWQGHFKFRRKEPVIAVLPPGHHLAGRRLRLIQSRYALRVSRAEAGGQDFLAHVVQRMPAAWMTRIVP